MFKIPEHPVLLMRKVYRDVLPVVHEKLAVWKEKAEKIPSKELRKQALHSIETKSFHCEGGGIIALLSGHEMNRCVDFIVAYQTISDYLDNLCDRSTSLDPKDFRMLHQAMLDALTVDAPVRSYYQYRDDQNDGGYLHELVKTCQGVLKELAHYSLINNYLLELCQFYCDLQVHKHVKEEERVPRLKKWFDSQKKHVPNMEWYEFSACTGSTLGIFCLVSYAFNQAFTVEMARKIRNGYFPYVQGLHILLDYLIDQKEDELEGDLNFCTYYDNEQKMMERMEHFIQEADRHLEGLPNERFHRLINRGLIGVYLSDEKVHTQKELTKWAKKLVKMGGTTSVFFYFNGRAYRKFQKLWMKSS